MSKIFKLVMPVILLILGVQFTRDYFGDSSSKERKNLEQLVNSGQETMAILKEEYTEKTIKIAKIPIKTYEIGYTFKVGEKEFEGKHSLTAPPTEPMIKVKYLPTDPTINAATPEQKLASLVEDEKSGSKLYFGLGLMAVGLLLGFFRIRSFSQG